MKNSKNGRKCNFKKSDVGRINIEKFTIRKCKKLAVTAVICVLGLTACTFRQNEERAGKFLNVDAGKDTGETEKTEKTGNRGKTEETDSAKINGGEEEKPEKAQDAGGLYRTMEAYADEIFIPETGSGYMEEDCYFLPGCTGTNFREFKEGLEQRKFQMHESVEYEQASGGTCLKENIML